MVFGFRYLATAAMSCQQATEEKMCGHLLMSGHWLTAEEGISLVHRPEDQGKC